MIVIIANTFFIVASILMFISGIQKNKKNIVINQTIQILITTIGDLILGGYTAALINIISILRNILSYKEKLNLPIKIVLSIISVVFSIFINDLGVIGFFPVIVMLLFIWFMNTKDVVKYKYLMIVSLSLWFVYDFTIKAYIGAIFDAATVMASVISIIQIKRINNQKSKRGNLNG